LGPRFYEVVDVSIKEIFRLATIFRHCWCFIKEIFHLSTVTLTTESKLVTDMPKSAETEGLLSVIPGWGVELKKSMQAFGPFIFYCVRLTKQALYAPQIKNALRALIFSFGGD
jgi:hypothetical protein